MNKEKKNLLRLVDNFEGKQVSVWGDFILDEYIFGTTRRISREAPVLILSYRKSGYSLGGAGNSVLNLKALGAEPLPGRRGASISARRSMTRKTRAAREPPLRGREPRQLRGVV